MRRFLVLLSIVLASIGLTACDSFVEEVNEPRDEAPVDQFTTPQDINFLATGVKAQFAETTAEMVPIADLLSDQFRFGRNDNDATFPTFINLDAGAPQEQSNSVDAAFNDLGEYRRLADDLLGPIRATEEFGENAPISRNEALFTAHFHGGIARYYYAVYFGLNPREGGGVINKSPFIPSAAMYDSARVKFERARAVAPSERQTKILNSVEARSALYAGTEFGSDAGGYSNALQRAADLASQGLKQGDEPFLSLYNQQDPNGWYFAGGFGRVQIAAQDGNIAEEVQVPGVSGAYKNPDALRSFPEIVENNPAEAARIPLIGVTASVQFLPFDPAEGLPADAVDFAQNKYPERASSLSVMSWQENHLIRAELELRGFSTGDKSALQLVNEVRSSFGLSDLSDVNMETIAQERDRTLFGQGQRLPDQRRLDVLDWHLVESFDGTTTWKYFPITRQERDANPNL